MAIRSFRCARTERLFRGAFVKDFASCSAVAMRKLAMLNAAERLQDLRVPPGNRLEALQGDRAGQFSIRVNDQFRLCFRWIDGGPTDVEMLDYH